MLFPHRFMEGLKDLYCNCSFSGLLQGLLLVVLMFLSELEIRLRMSWVMITINAILVTILDMTRVV